jgi:hypothetical protein
LTKLGRQSVENVDHARWAPAAPQLGHGGAGDVDDGTSSSNRVAHAAQTYSKIGIALSVGCRHARAG